MSCSSECSDLEVYTRPGCKFCRIAKAKLESLGILSWKEFDISAESPHPNKIYADSLIVKQRLLHARNTSVPQIYIGDEHIGGCDDLLKDVESGNFYDRLKRWNISTNFSIETSMASTTSPKKAHYTPLVPVRCLNESPIRISMATVSPLELSRTLQTIMSQLTDNFVSPDGKRVDYKAMSLSFEFENYCQLTNSLREYTLKTLTESMTDNQRFSFFVNVYNALIIHSTCVLGPAEDSPTGRAAFFSGANKGLYDIGGYLFSPDDIEHGILRANTAHPSKQALGETRYFSDDDPRSILAVKRLDPRVHFLLNCGASSCPPISILGEDPETALQLAATAYLDSEIYVDIEKRVLYLPKLLLWYSRDFHPNGHERVSEVINRILPMLSDNKRKAVTKSLQVFGWEATNDDVVGFTAGSSFLPSALTSSLDSGLDRFQFEVQYNPYNWTPNVV